MWWLMSLFRDARVDNGAVMIADPDTPAAPLPVAKGNVFSLPDGIAFPYDVSFPLKQGPLRDLRLRVTMFGTDQPVGLRYELWPAENGYVMFYPRWVDRRLDKRTYVFDYAWRFSP